MPGEAQEEGEPTAAAPEKDWREGNRAHPTGSGKEPPDLPHFLLTLKIIQAKKFEVKVYK